jgi:hypothetical protein
MVGATGIEPVTPTMSGSARAISRNFWSWRTAANLLRFFTEITLQHLTSIPVNIISVLTHCLPGSRK